MTNSNQEELEKIEDKLRKEEKTKNKIPMPISGRSVFELKKIKDNQSKSNK